VSGKDRDSNLSSNKEKIRIAITSIVASAALTLLKLAIGLSVNSLGILSEALHSGLDVIAAIMTYHAVRMAMRPADTRYTYGYAKYESVASLIEIILLFAVAIWISYEGLDRIFFKKVGPELTVFAFAIMFISIAVDFGRSKVLYSTARKYGSQALEADGLHFKTDMITSSIVIAGLLVVLILKIPNADAYAALVIAVLIIYTSLGLGRRTLDVLLDKAPKGLTAQVTEVVSGLDGVKRAHGIRARKVGSETFIDMRIEVPRAFTHDKAHRVATEVEERVKKAVGESSVLVHVDAIKSDDETILDKVRLIAFETEGIKNVHSIYLSDMSSFTESKSASDAERRVLHLYLDIQMDGNLDLKSAHELVDSFEKRIKAEIPEVNEITSHIETEASGNLAVGTERVDVDREYMERIRKLVLSVAGVADCKNIGITTVAGETHITLTIILSNTDSRKMTIQEAHRIATNVQNVIVKQTGAARVIVHEEPS
jgi:cation diffusion facilitator family transporter